MTRLFLVVGGILTHMLICLGQDTSVSQMQSEIVKSDSVQRADSLQVNFPEPEMKSAIPEFTIHGKARIEVDRTFDVTAQPLTISERESAKVEFERFPKSETGFLPVAKGFSGKLSVGYGTYETPMFDGWIGSASGQSDILLRGNFKSTQGRFDFQDFHKGYGGLSAGTYVSNNAGFLSDARLNAGIGFHNEKYKLYGSITPQRARSVTRFEGRVGVLAQYPKRGFFEWAVSFNNASVSDSVNTHENRIGVEVNGGSTIDRTHVRAEMDLWRTSYTAPSPKQDPYFGNLRVTAEYKVSEGVSVTGGGLISLFRGSELDSRVQAYPIGGIEWRVARGVTFFASYQPYVAGTTFSSFVQTNPYLWYDINLRNTEYYQSVSVGTRLALTKVLKANLKMNYSKIENYPIFSKMPENLWNVVYGGMTRLTSFASDVFMDFDDFSRAAISFAVNHSRVSDIVGIPTGVETDLPSVPRVTASGMVQHRFPFGLSITSTAKYIGRQTVEVSSARKLPAFVLWDGRIEYALSARLTAGVVIENILDRQQYWWENYRGESRRMVLMVGYTL